MAKVFWFIVGLAAGMILMSIAAQGTRNRDWERWAAALAKEREAWEEERKRLLALQPQELPKSRMMTNQEYIEASFHASIIPIVHSGRLGLKDLEPLWCCHVGSSCPEWIKEGQDACNKCVAVFLNAPHIGQYALRDGLGEPLEQEDT